jgi:hypothetical protein
VLQRNQFILRAWPHRNNHSPPYDKIELLIWSAAACCRLVSNRS